MNTLLPLLSFKNISAKYGHIQALYDVSLEIYEKEIVTLIGANGAGKSTLMMSVFGQPRISAGKILLHGQAIEQLPTYQIAKLGIQIAPEGRRIFTKMTTEENLWMGIIQDADKEKIKNKFNEIYDLFPILHRRRNQRAGTLSGGEQQMLSIGRALMSEPKLLMLDEPSLGLAPQLVKQIFATLRHIAQLGTTIFLVEQNVHLALNLADRAYVLANGHIQLAGNSKDLIVDPKIQAAYFGSTI